MAEFKRDCKSFREDYACEVMTAEGLKDCSGCMFYEPISKKILLIKLGALGDILRTTPLLFALKKKYGNNCHITWLVDEGEGKDILKNNSNIDKILVSNHQTILRLKHEKFNILINLDIDQKATLVANEVRAEEKLGYYFNEDGKPSFFNKSSEYYLNRVFSNYLNKTNRKTYQEMIFEIAELPYNKEESVISNIDKNYANEFMKKHDLTKKDKIICINLGSSDRWPSKAWHQDNIIELTKKLKKEEYKVLIRGGPNEEGLLEEVFLRVKGKDVFSNLPEILPISKLTALLSLCDRVITGDTLVLHIAIALRKKTIALFFCTPPWEIEGYGVVKKLISPLLDQNFYTDSYDKKLTKSISALEVFKAIKNG